MELYDRNESLLANDIYAVAQLLKAYCEKYADDIYEICIMTIFIELLSSLSKELCSRY